MRLNECQRFGLKIGMIVDNKIKMYSCWLWKAGQRGDAGKAYGNFRLSGGGKTVGAHRYAYEEFYGPIPDGLLVRHRCHQPLCCNPLHLVLGTNADNSQDMIDAGRQPRQGYYRKLSGEQVRSARERHADGASIAALAREYGVDRKTLREALTGRHYRDVA